MTNSAKIKLNDWARIAIPLVCILLAGWGTYNVLIYRVCNLEEDVSKAEEVQEDAHEKVWSRLASDEKDRANMKDKSVEIQRSVDNIQTVQGYMANDIKLIKEAVVK